MKEVLSALNKGDVVLLETEKLPEFWQFCFAQKDFYAFRYEYSETLVKINLVGKDTIIKMKI